MSRIIVELADPTCDRDLRKIYSENEMEGNIAVSFQREPSYFHASSVQAPFTQVCVARDKENNKIMAVVSRAVRTGFINGEPQNVGYLADLRLDPKYRGSFTLPRGYQFVEKLHKDGMANIYFAVITEGNHRALNTLTANRPRVPQFKDLGRLLSPAINLLRPKPPLSGDFEIINGSKEILPDILNCLNRNMSRRQFAPNFKDEHFLDVPWNESKWLRDFDVHDFYVARRSGRVIGIVGKWDQSAYKQTVVTRYSGMLRYLRPLFNFAGSLLGFARYPDPGLPLKYFYASFIAIDNDDVFVLRSLLRRIYNDHVGSSYNYFLVGLHELDPLVSALSDFRLTPFTARIFAVCFQDDVETFHQLDGRVPHVELALL